MTYLKDASPIVANKPIVVLVHGLHQNTWVMRLLGHRLSSDFTCAYFRYYSLQDDITTHSQRLLAFLQTLITPNTPTTVHFVAHSLGGLVVRHYLAQHTLPKGLQLGYIVTLGTPHLGSQTAHYIQRFAPALLGKAYNGALDGILPKSKKTRLGVIAGNRGIGLGQPLLHYHHRKHPNSDTANDGTVYVHETRLGNCPHCIMPVSHTGLLTNKNVAKQVVHFLQNGQFY